MRVHFVSGHGNLTFEEWLLYYKPLVDTVLLNNEGFIMGDFRGCDVITMEYLKDKTPNVVVCHCKEKPRYFPETLNMPSSLWQLNGGFLNDADRDVYMTHHSHADIAWIRQGREKSGTAKNIKRRLQGVQT